MPQFGTNGLRKLLLKGSQFPDCRHLAASFPATSIATLATGTWPSQHGIVAGSWYDPSSRNSVAASSEALLTGTLCSQIAAEQNTRTYVIGSDALQTGLFAGDSQTRQFWMDSAGRFTTLGEVPEWLTAANNLNPIENARNAPWMAIDARSGAPPLRTLTYDAEHPQDFLSLYRASPLAQKAQFELLRALIENNGLGQQDTFDFVCLISSASSLLGFDIGARSPLMGQMVLHLDRHIEYLFDSLKTPRGEVPANIVLAGGHGVPPAPGEEARARMAVPGESVAQAVNKALAANGMGKVLRYVYPFLYLDTSGFRDPEQVRLAAARAAMRHPAVAACYTAGGYCTVRDDFEARFRNSFHPLRSGDVMISYRAGYVEEFGQNRGVSYGSLYNYDVSVPLCFYGPQFRTGVFESPVQSVDLAATLARACGVPAPPSSVGRVLGEALAE